MLSSNLSRRGALAATVVAPLFIVADLLGLFTVSFQGPTDAIIIQNIIAVGAGVVLLLVLIAVYGPHLETMGTPALVGFLVILAGLVLAVGAFIWAYSLGEQGWSLFFIWTSLVANLGWILLGTVSLETKAYPREAVILLIVGAGLYGVANALIGSGAQSGVLAGNQNYVVGVMTFNIILSLAIALVSMGPLRRRKEED